MKLVGPWKQSYAARENGSAVRPASSLENEAFADEEPSEAKPVTYDDSAAVVF